MNVDGKTADVKSHHDSFTSMNESSSHISTGSSVVNEENGDRAMVSSKIEEVNFIKACGVVFSDDSSIQPSAVTVVVDANDLRPRRRTSFTSTTSFRLPKTNKDTLSHSISGPFPEATTHTRQTITGPTTTRTTRLRHNLSGLSGFLPHSISQRINAQQENNGIVYDGGSLNPIRMQREDLNFDKLRRLKSEARPMPSFDRWKMWLEAKMRTNNDKSQSSQQIHIPPFTDNNICLLTGIRHFFHFAFHDATFWLINTNSTNFFFVQFLCYYVFVLIFSCFIYLCTLAYYSYDARTCLSQMVTPVGSNFSDNMEYSFELSWTTFSTVGYGVESPSHHLGCVALRLLCSVEAALGILYFGFAGAIFFARVSRILSQAPVTFSSTLCIQYDTCQASSSSSPQLRGPDGTTRPHHHLQMLEVSNLVHNTPLLSPKYPTLEFRIVHNKANYKGWEILNARINCMVAIDVLTYTECNDLAVLFDFEVIDEDDDNSRRVSKQTYHKVHLEAETHPYFKRVWHCRHILNEQSPLLTKSMREEILAVGGWPSYRDSTLSIRSALMKFKAMVYLSKSDTDTKISLLVGSSGLIYLKESARGEGQAKVDLSLIHDIRPQNGGGEERLGSDRLAPFSRPHRRVQSSVFESRRQNNLEAGTKPVERS